ncbi:MAG: GNAT family N-acetyltransferase [Acidimicrobiales bacterium]
MLRPWHAADAPALAEAWGEQLIQRWLDPPPNTVARATAWIRDAESRRTRAVALDLVIEVGGAVAGEIGFSGFEGSRRAAMLGYWVAAEHRGAGLAARACAAAAPWFLQETDGSAVLAECDPANVASWRTAEHAGLAHIGDHAGNAVYALTRPRDEKDPRVPPRVCPTP